MAAATPLFADLSASRPLPPREEMERAFLAGDPGYDGVFLTAVRSTGIFCRPSCGARKPRPENVEFFASIGDAMSAGYRPCLRCRPIDSEASTPDWVRRLLASIEDAPGRRLGDADLRAMGIDPARARRYFVRAFGMTFQAYCRGRRLARALHVIRSGGTVDDAVFDSGYESYSGFRDSFARTFGRPPGQSRDADCIHVAWLETPLGPMVAGASTAGVCLLEFTDRRMLETELATLRRELRQPLLPGETGHLQRLRDELRDYFAARRTAFSVPLVTVGSAFERRVWDELLRIPHGAVSSYDEIARRIGAPTAARAVGRANGRNRIAIVIPCHRVIAKNGDLSGYGGGVWRKRLLLHLERTGTSLR